ncbi:MAG TPA: SCO family protein [Pyrinomonadaceae bacterium]|nr:SCO family protein [Pyrinomonadaceae bacterium]
MKYTLFVFTAFLLFAACKTATPPAPSASAKRYPFKGTVVSVDKQKKTASIDHEAVDGYMDAMTMDFPIHEDWVWNDLVPGSQIQAELVVDNSAKDPFWLEKIAISAAPNANQPPPPSSETPPQIGKTVPDIKLTDQDGKRFSLTDYRGKALAVTFIYRDCPLPDYCIKMSRNFSDLAVRIAADPAYAGKVKLLSISFDPARDTPEKLKQYGQGYMGNPAKPDFSIWRLAVGSDKEVRAVAGFFGLKYEVDQNDKALINHSLVTAVIGPDGTVKKIFAGNRWTPDELLKALEETVR